MAEQSDLERGPVPVVGGDQLGVGPGPPLLGPLEVGGRGGRPAPGRGRRGTACSRRRPSPTSAGGRRPSAGCWAARRSRRPPARRPWPAPACTRPRPDRGPRRPGVGRRRPTAGPRSPASACRRASRLALGGPQLPRPTRSASSPPVQLRPSVRITIVASASDLCRRVHFAARSHTVGGRAWIGSSARNRRKSSANAWADA